MNALTSDPTPDWTQIRPLLDDALDHLDRADRDALLLRFFEQRTLAEVGHVLGSTEDAARKRVTRALEKLRTDLIRRGVTTTSAALSAVLLANVVQAAPAGLAATLTSASVASAACGTGSAVTLLKVMTMTKLKVAIASAAVVAGVATPLVIQHHHSEAKLREENESLRQQVEQLAQLSAENERLSNLVVAAAESRPLPDSQANELLRLRGEIVQLKAAEQLSLGPSATQGTRPREDSARQLALAAAQGDPAGLANLRELAKGALEDFKTNSVGLTDQGKDELSRKAFGPLWSAYDVLTEEAVKGNQTAITLLAQGLRLRELKGSSVKALGALAANGDENALEVLLHPSQYDVLLSSVVGALKPAADSGNQKAIDALAAVAADGKQGPLWYMAADGLGKAAESGNPVAIDALISLSGATNQNVRHAAAEGLARAAANQNVKAAEALGRMGGR
jgi:coenzyme F420-reducing hydrogenase delta subunit